MGTKIGWLACSAFVVVLLAFPPLVADLAAAPQVAPPTPPPAAQAKAEFDPVAATEAYLAKVSPEQQGRADAHFEGGHWLAIGAA